jgi:hypothetical protein
VQPINPPTNTQNANWGSTVNSTSWCGHHCRAPNSIAVMLANSVILLTVASRPPIALPHSADAGVSQFDRQHSVQDADDVAVNILK